MAEISRADRAAPRGVFARLKAIGSHFVEAGLEWNRDNALRLSAAVSYYAVLSLAPLLAIVIRVMALAHARKFAGEQMFQQAANLMGKQAADAIKPIIESNGRGAGNLATVISTFVLLFSATGVFVELKNALNTIWGAQRKARRANPAHEALLTFIESRLVPLALVFGFGFLIVASMFISGAMAALKQRVADADRWPGYLAELGISVGAVFVVFAILYKWLTDAKLKWRNVWHGATVAAVLFTIGRLGLAVYFRYSTINSVYGAAGSLVAVLTWIYYSCFSFFYGAEFAKVLTRRSEGGGKVFNK